MALGHLRPPGLLHTKDIVCHEDLWWMVVNTAPLLSGKAGRIGIVQTGEEKLWGDLSVAMQGLRGATRMMEHLGLKREVSAKEGKSLP